MKKIFFVSFAFLALVLTAAAQPGGGFNRRTPEERAAQLHKKLDSAFKLDKDVMTKLDTAFVQLFKAQDAKREELMASGTRDREVFMSEMKKYSDARDEMLKAVLNEEQYKTWKEKIEPGMRPQRGPGAGGPGGNK